MQRGCWSKRGWGWRLSCRWQSGDNVIKLSFSITDQARKPHWGERLSTFDLLALTGLDRLLFMMKISFTFFTKQATLNRRSTVPSLPNKRSSLVQKFTNYGQQSFITLVPGPCLQALGWHYRRWTSPWQWRWPWPSWCRWCWTCWWRSGEWARKSLVPAANVVKLLRP